MRELSLNVMDVVQNSISAGASLIEIGEKTLGNELIITIRDNGRGMTAEQAELVTNPFYTTRTTRDVGLGIPLFKMACEQTGGSLLIESKEGCGTLVTALFIRDHIDMTPVGDMNETVLLLITCNPQIDFVYSFEADGHVFSLDTRELREVLDGVPLSSPEVSAWIKDYLKEGKEGIS